MTLRGLQADVGDAKGLDVLACSLYSRAEHLPSRTRPHGNCDAERCFPLSLHKYQNIPTAC
jgi:hypothetical protein